MSKSTNTPVIYQFNDKEFRLIEKDGEPWFIASDVCDILGLENVSKALNGLDDDEKADITISEVSSNGVKQNRKRAIINEPGYYSLILRSRKPEAKAFKRLVTHEILPSIRKTGSYGTPKPTRTPDEVTARSLAVTLRQMARQSVYPDEMKAVFLAEAASGLSGQPINRYLPPCVRDQENWLMATQIAEHFGPEMHANTIGKALKALNLHGENDLEHNWSKFLWTQYNSKKQGPVCVYNPDVVIPALTEYFASKNLAPESVVLPFDAKRKVVN